ncbi:MAG: tetratricopeptide repeat protein [Candidatus Thermoplasmatota archaeon]
MFKLSARERILIYLDDNIEKQLSLKKSVTPPTIFCQANIEEAIGVSHRLVSEGLASLENEGAIDGKKFHVRDTGRFRTFYFLTSYGILRARELKDEIGKTKIKIREKDEIRETELSVLVEELKRITKEQQSRVEVGYINVLRNITSDGFLDIKAILEPRKYVDFSEKRPEYKYFFGRKEELNEINEFMKSKTSKILVIKGIAGIGKTTLVSKFLETLEINVFWYGINEWTTLRNILTYISDFLLRIERRRLKMALEREQIDLTDISILLDDELKNTNSLLVFDDVQKSNAEIVQFLSSLKELAERVEGIKLIAIGREMPLFYDRKDVAMKKLVQEISLTGLDIENGKKILNRRKVKEMEQDRLYELTNGHPLLLELVSLSPEITPEISKYIKEEIYLRLDGEEKRVLSLASTFRHPFPVRAVLAEDIDYEVIEKLVNKSLMQRAIDSDAYNLHDILREFFYNRLTPKKKTVYHSMAAQFYQKEVGRAAIIEALYHWLKAEAQENAMKLLVENGTELITGGYIEELIDNLNMVDEKKVQKKDLISILILKGSIYIIKGEWNIAIETFKKSLEISEEINDVEKIADGYWGIGKVYLYKGDIDEAVGYLNRSIEHAKRINNVEGEAKAYMDLGNVYSGKGEYERAIELYGKSLSVFERLGNKHEICRGYHNLAITYYKIGEYDVAIRYHEKQIKLAEEQGFVRMRAFGLGGLSWNYARKGEADKAFYFCEEALSLAKRLGEIRLVAMCHGIHGVNFAHVKEWDKSTEHFEKGIEIYKESENIGELSWTYFDYGKMYKEKGDLKKAREQFENAIRAFEKIGNEKKVAEIKREIEEIRKTRNSPRPSLEQSSHSCERRHSHDIG